MDGQIVRRWAYLAFLAAAFAGAPAEAVRAAALGTLLERAETEGSVRVIVELAAPFAPEGRLSTARAAAQRRGIATAQTGILAALSGTDHRVRWLYASIPYAALEVGPAGLRALERSPWVLALEEDELHRFALDVSVPLVGADELIAAGFDGAGQTVVVIDTGVDGAHPNLAGKLVDEACFASKGAGPNNGDCPNGQDVDFSAGSGSYCDYSTECFHGTHVAGIAVGSGPSYSGVAQGADLISIQVASRYDSESVCGIGEAPCPRPIESDMVKAAEEVFDNFRYIHPVAALNLSIAGPLFSSQASCDANNGAMKAAIDNLRSIGIATVIAAGNDGATDAIGEPGCISSAVSVGATNDSDVPAGFSNAASFLSLWAPGVLIRAPKYMTTTYRNASGTSMATPHVAGAWAILRDAVPGISVDAALAALQSTGQPISHPTANTTRIDVRAAYASLTVDCQDSLDNDGDGRTDWAGGDPGCDDASDASETSDLLPCDNGVDDDGDGFVDTADPACSSGDPWVPDPAAAAELTQCQDGVNNDAALGTDFDAGESILGAGNGDPDGPDPECSGKPWKNLEQKTSRCGLGLELCLLLPVAGWLRRLRRRR